jgi:hypothetical protein
MPRFLPTLTEVVLLPMVETMQPPGTPDLEDTVKFVMQRVDGFIERRLREEFDAMLRTMMTEQIQGLGGRLRQELDSVVRQAVSDALVPTQGQHKSN